MSKNFANISSDNRNNDANNKISFSKKLEAFLPCISGVLMVLMIALMLILDLIAPTSYDTFKKIFRDFDCLIMAGGLVLLVAKILERRLSLFLRDYLFGAFMLCIAISTYINGLSEDAVFGIPYRCVGIFNMLAFFVVYMKVSAYTEKGSLRHFVLMGYLAVADVVAITALYEQYLGDIPAYQGKTGVCAIFGNSNHYGYFLAMATMLGIGYYIYEVRVKSFFGAASAILNLFVLVLNNTLGAMIAVGLCIAVTVLILLISEKNYNKKDEERKALSLTAKRALLLAVFAIVAVITTMAASSAVRASILELFRDIGSIITGTSSGAEGSGRGILWQTVMNYIAEKPIFGHGCEGISERLLNETGIGDSHCEPLTYAAYYGIPGALFYLAGVIAAAVNYFKDRKYLPSYCRIAFLGASAYFVSSLVGVAIFYTAPFFFIFIGMASEDWKEI